MVNRCSLHFLSSGKIGSTACASSLHAKRGWLGPIGTVKTMRTLTIPRYTATDAQVKTVKRESMVRYGIPYVPARRDTEAAQANGSASCSPQL